MNANLSVAEGGHAPVAAPHPTHKFALLLRREFWEHKGGFLWAPVIAGGISLVLTLLLLVLYQDDAAAGVSLESVPTITASATAPPAHSGTP